MRIQDAVQGGRLVQDEDGNMLTPDGRYAIVWYPENAPLGAEVFYVVFRIDKAGPGQADGLMQVYTGLSEAEAVDVALSS